MGEKSLSYVLLLGGKKSLKAIYLSFQGQFGGYSFVPPCNMQKSRNESNASISQGPPSVSSSHKELGTSKDPPQHL